MQTITAVPLCFPKYAYGSPNNCVQRQPAPGLAHEFWEELMCMHLKETHYSGALYSYTKYTHHWPSNGPLLWVTNHRIQCNNVTSHLKSTLSCKVLLNILFQLIPKTTVWEWQWQVSDIWIDWKNKESVQVHLAGVQLFIKRQFSRVKSTGSRVRVLGFASLQFHLEVQHPWANYLTPLSLSALFCVTGITAGSTPESGYKD